jgi:hypothetical protein
MCSTSGSEFVSISALRKSMGQKYHSFHKEKRTFAGIWLCLTGVWPQRTTEKTQRAAESFLICFFLPEFSHFNQRLYSLCNSVSSPWLSVGYSSKTGPCQNCKETYYPTKTRSSQSAYARAKFSLCSLCLCGKHSNPIAIGLTITE